MKKRLNRLMALGLAAVVICGTAMPMPVYAAPAGHDSTHAVQHVNAKAAACNEDGNVEYYYCDACDDGKYYEEESLDTEIEEISISKETATHTLVDVAEEAGADCEHEGVIAHKNCTTCEKNFDDDGNELDSVSDGQVGDHTLEDVAASAASCTVQGTKAHQKCSKCNKTFVNGQQVTLDSLAIPVIAHNAMKTDAKEATATENGNIAYWHCEVCGKYFSDEALTKEITIDDTVINAVGEPLTQTQSFVHRLYEKCLGRLPETAGMEDWNTALVNKEKTGAEVAYGFVFSEEYKLLQTTNEEFVDMLYQVIMGRDADEEGKAYWLEKLQQGMSREYVFRGFAESSEYTAICDSYGIERGGMTLGAYRDQNEAVTGFVARIYTEMLGRSFDEEGLEYWCEKYVTGKQSVEEIMMIGFLQSEEVANLNLSDEEFVTRMYRTFLNREPEAEGLAYWMERLENGQETRDSIVYGFSLSQEFKNIKQTYGLN